MRSGRISRVDEDGIPVGSLLLHLNSLVSIFTAKAVYQHNPVRRA